MNDSITVVATTTLVAVEPEGLDSVKANLLILFPLRDAAVKYACGVS
jgi:hypothetical protein